MKTQGLLAVLMCLFGWVVVPFTVLAVEELQGRESWPRFRGPNGEGIYEGHGFPTVLRSEDILWKCALAGLGHSSPVIAGGRVFTASADLESGQQILEAFDLDSGRKIWSRTLPGKTFPKHDFNSFASSTPALDEARLYYAWAIPESLRVVALAQNDGSVLWQVDLRSFTSQHGFGASPVLWKDLVILPNEQDGESFVVALDRRTGQVRWKTPRRIQKTAYSTPSLLSLPDGEAQLVLTSWAHGICALRPETGQPIWELPVFHNRTVGSPLVIGNWVIASSGEGGIGRELYVVHLNTASPEQAPKVAYQVTTSIPYVPTPVAYEGRVYLLYDKGVMTYLDLKTGDVIWRQRLPGEYFSSPLIINKKVYCVSRTGTLVVVAAADQFQLLGTSELEEGTHSTPAVADGVLVIRTFRSLLAVKSLDASKISGY